MAVAAIVTEFLLIPLFYRAKLFARNSQVKLVAASLAVLARLVSVYLAPRRKSRMGVDVQVLQHIRALYFAAVNFLARSLQ